MKKANPKIKEKEEVGLLNRRGSLFRTLLYTFYILTLLTLFTQYGLGSFLGKHLPPRTAFWSLHWYEFIFVFLFILALIRLISAPRKIAWTIADYFFLAWFIFSLLSALLQPNKSQGLEGFRVDSFLAISYFVSRAFLPQFKPAKILIQSTLSVSLLTIIESFLPINYMRAIFPASFGEHFVGYIPRTSLLLGPNQLGTLIAGLASVSLGYLYLKNNLKLAILLAFISSYALATTFSRNASLGYLFALIILATIAIVKKLRFRFAVILIASLPGFLIANTIQSERFATSWEEIFKRSTSTSEHISAIESSLMRLSQFSTKEKIIGKELGTAGPLGNLPESWYLQILEEMGIVGLLIWLGLQVSLLVIVLQRGDEGLPFILLISTLGINALFLHTWADNPLIAIGFSIYSANFINRTHKE